MKLIKYVRWWIGEHDYYAPYRFFINPIKTTKAAIRNKIVYPLKHHGLPADYWWSAVEPIGNMVLKATYDLQRRPLGVPSSFLKDPYNNDGNIDKEAADWKKTIKKIRFSFFIYTYGEDLHVKAEFAKDLDEVKWTYRRFLKKHPYCRGLASWRMMKNIYLNKLQWYKMFYDEPLMKEVEEGMQLFAKYYPSLWS